MQLSLCQNYFDTLKTESPVTAGIFDAQEIVIASTNSSLVGLSFGKTNISSYKIFEISSKLPELRLFVDTSMVSETEVHLYASMISTALMAIFKIYTENYDSENFMKRIIEGEAKDIPSHARILKIQDEAIRVVFVINAEPKHVEGVLQIVQNMAVGRNDFLFEKGSGEIVFIRTCKTEPSAGKLHGIAKQISDAVATEVLEFVSVGIGAVVYNLEDVERSYKSAVNALDIGEIFANKNKIYAYSNLGISRLISSVPIGKCKAFLNEVMSHKILSEIDEETLNSIQTFLDCDMNIALAAKSLYIHRNTMVYRLDRLQKQTGLDVRKFEDAMLFEIAMMIHKYLRATRQ